MFSKGQSNSIFQINLDFFYQKDKHKSVTGMPHYRHEQ